MESSAKDLMFALLRRELHSGAFSEEADITLTETEAEALYALSCRFGLAHLIGDALKKSGAVLPEAIAEKFRDKTDRAVYRYCVMQNEIDRISALFDKEKIPYIPLKGAVIRSWYPKPWMRFSNDIDILIHSEDMGRAENALVSGLHYERFNESRHDVSFLSKTNIRLELHYDLIEDGRANGAKAILKTAWEHTEREQDSFRCTFDSPMFYFYHISHMTKHFENGQCGIRPFLDLWILKHRKAFQGTECSRLLAEGNLTRFAELSNCLSAVWLDGREHDEDTLRLEKFVWDGSNNNGEAVLTKKDGRRWRAILTKIFLPYDNIRYQYPILQKYRFLTPIMEVCRWGKLISRGRLKRSVHMIRNIARLTDEKVQDTKILFETLGLS